VKERIVVIGGGGHAKVIISILKKINSFDIVVFTDIDPKGNILGIEYLGTDEILQDLFYKNITNVAIGLGQIKSSSIRKNVVSKLEKIGFQFPSIVSPNSIINEDVLIGNGTVIMDGVVINSGTKIGEFSIINTNSSIDHDCKIGNFTHIAPGVTLSGDVFVGDDVLIGTGANVIQGIKIFSKSIISAGSSLLSSNSKSGIYRGVPAKLIKEIK